MPSIRAVYVIRPETRQLVRDDITYPAGDQPVVVELGAADYTADAVEALAVLVSFGHPIDVRGNRHHAALAHDIWTLAAARWDVDHAQEPA